MDAIERLVGCGYDTPRKIELATDEELHTLAGLDKAEITTIRQQYPSVLTRDPYLQAKIIGCDYRVLHAQRIDDGWATGFRGKVLALNPEWCASDIYQEMGFRVIWKENKIDEPLSVIHDLPTEFNTKDVSTRFKKRSREYGIMPPGENRVWNKTHVNDYYCLARVMESNLRQKLHEIRAKIKTGWPDLLVIKNNSWRFVEIKTTDNVHENQLLLWRDHLLPNGVQIEIGHLRRPVHDLDAPICGSI